MMNLRLPKVKGTKKSVSNNQLLISSGLPSLDSVIGGGIPISSLFLVEEDEFGVFSNIVLKHYLSEGVLSEHALLIVSQQLDAKKLVRDLPSPTNNDQPEETPKSLPNMDELKIAWRYQDLPSGETFKPKNVLFGHTYDLTKRLDKALLSKTEINYWKNKSGEFTYDNLLSYIKEAVQNEKYDLNTPVENRTVLRIALHLMGTIFWEGDLVKFLINLRVLLRNSCSTCLITVSPDFFEDRYMLYRCEHICDTVIGLQSLMNEGNPAYSEYSGLLLLPKLPIINSWNSYIPEANDWAFTLKKRKHFIIEKLHISPEFMETVHREEEDIAAEYQTQKIIKNVAEEF